MSAVGRRYAKALFALAKEANRLEATANELERLASVTSDPSVAPVIRSPLLSATRRRELVDTFISELALSPLLTHFVRLLTDHHRLGELLSIHDHFQRLLDTELGRMRLSVRTATTLTASQQAAIVAAFAKLSGKQVMPTISVDPALLGGVVVEIAGKVYDGSVRTQLDRLAKELAGTAAL